jgi:hypothetical protein
LRIQDPRDRIQSDDNTTPLFVAFFRENRHRTRVISDDRAALRAPPRRVRLDSILKRSLRALSATRTHSEEDEDEEEEEMRLVKHSADSIAALRAMEYRRGRKALVKDKFAKKLAGTKYATNAC